MDITSAISSFKTMADITALMINLSTDSRVTEKAIELQSALLSLQSDMFGLQAQHQSLLREKEELEKRLIEIQNWQAEAQKYTLAEIVPGVFMYALKAEYKDATPPHWLCPNCYESRRKSVLQRDYNRIKHNYVFQCHHCNAELVDTSNAAMPS